jgi:hypothetical protein
MKHYMNCCTNKLTSYIYRQHNVGKLIARAINIHQLQNIIKTENGSIINWNQELRLPVEIRYRKKTLM